MKDVCSRDRNLKEAQEAGPSVASTGEAVVEELGNVRAVSVNTAASLGEGKSRTDTESSEEWPPLEQVIAGSEAEAKDRWLVEALNPDGKVQDPEALLKEIADSLGCCLNFSADDSSFLVSLRENMEALIKDAFKEREKVTHSLVALRCKQRRKSGKARLVVEVESDGKEARKALNIEKNKLLCNVAIYYNGSQVPCHRNTHAPESERRDPAAVKADSIIVFLNNMKRLISDSNGRLMASPVCVRHMQPQAPPV